MLSPEAGERFVLRSRGTYFDLGSGQLVPAAHIFGEFQELPTALQCAEALAEAEDILESKRRTGIQLGAPLLEREIHPYPTQLDEPMLFWQVAGVVSVEEILAA